MPATDESRRRHALLEKLHEEHPDWGRIKLAKNADIPLAAVQRWMKRHILKQEQSVRGDFATQIPEGHLIKGVSTFFDQDGNIRGQWVKSKEDTERSLELLEAAVADIVEDCRGLAAPTPPPAYNLADIMATYPVADAHVGLYAWAAETGEDFDADKAEAMLLGCMEHLVNSAPPAETALIANVADFFHTDTEENRTRKSHNILDVDSRYARVLIIGIRCFRKMIQMALKKHKTVYVRAGKGNHDEHSGLALAMMMTAYFENEPRVNVALPISPFAYHQFGRNLIGIHHGDIKADNLPLIMATDMPTAWGKARHRTWLTGHIHHRTVKEYPGCTVESFRAAAAKDAWSHGSGYRSERDMQMIVFHREHGEVSRTRAAVGMF